MLNDVHTELSCIVPFFPSTPGTPNKDIMMSPTYRLIHGLDAEKPKPKVMLPPEGMCFHCASTMLHLA